MQINLNSSADTNLSGKANSIFGQTLGQSPQAKLKAKYLQSKNDNKAKIILGLSFLALVAYSVFFFYGNASAYLKASNQIKTLNQQVDNYTEEVIPQLEITKNAHKAAYDEDFQDVIQSLSIVFPEKIDKLGIVQLLESFAAEVNLVSPPFELTSINIGKVVDQKGYQVVPISTSIHSSQTGFDQFLALIEKSGKIYQDDQAENKVLLDKMVRLMSVSNVSIKYRGVDEKTGKDGGVDFSVKLNVYSRT